MFQFTKCGGFYAAMCVCMCMCGIYTETSVIHDGDNNPHILWACGFELLGTHERDTRTNNLGCYSGTHPLPHTLCATRAMHSLLLFVTLLHQWHNSVWFVFLPLLEASLSVPLLDIVSTVFSHHCWPCCFLTCLHSCRSCVMLCSVSLCSAAGKHHVLCLMLFCAFSCETKRGNSNLQKSVCVCVCVRD